MSSQYTISTINVQSVHHLYYQCPVSTPSVLPRFIQHTVSLAHVLVVHNVFCQHPVHTLSFLCMSSQNTISNALVHSEYHLSYPCIVRRSSVLPMSYLVKIHYYSLLYLSGIREYREGSSLIVWQFILTHSSMMAGWIFHMVYCLDVDRRSAWYSDGTCRDEMVYWLDLCSKGGGTDWTWAK